MKIFDTSSIVCLLKEIDESNVLSICEILGHDTYITKSVESELTKNPQTYKKYLEYGKIKVLNYDYNEKIESLKKKYPWMHDGEASVICAGEQFQEEGIQYYCIIDEKARSISNKNGLKTTGTIGILLWEYERQQLSRDDLRRIKQELQNAPFYLSEELLNKLDK